MALIVSYRFSSSLSPVPLDTLVAVAHWDVPGQMFTLWNCPDPGGGVSVSMILTQYLFCILSGFQLK